MDGITPFTTGKSWKGYHTVIASFNCVNACKEWQIKEPSNKTWANFETLFAQEYHDKLDQRNIITINSGCHSMHAAVDVFMVLDNLPKAAMADRYIVIKLATANSDLNEAVETFT